MKKGGFLIVCVFTLLSCARSIKEVIPIPVAFSPAYTVIESTDISTNATQMLRIKVTLPRGLSEKELIDNFRDVVLTNHAQTGVRDVVVFAYNEAREVDGSYTLAKYEFCPYGDWSRVGEPAADDVYAENYEISQSYFEPEAQLLKRGAKVEIRTQEEWDVDLNTFVPGKTTKLSSSSVDFNEDKIKLITNGAIAVILDLYSEDMTSEATWIAYQVQLSNGTVGWVMSHNISEVE